METIKAAGPLSFKVSVSGRGIVPATAAGVWLERLTQAQKCLTHLQGEQREFQQSISSQIGGNRGERLNELRLQHGSQSSS